MKEKNIEEDKPPRNSEQPIAWYQFILLFILIAVSAIFYFFTKKEYKAVLHKRYGVTPYIFNKWIELFCPEEIVQKYVGQKVKTVLTADIYRYLGKPDSYPCFTQDRKITSKDDFQRAYNISLSTLTRDIKKIEDPENTIGMSIGNYKTLQSFPPSKMILICKYLEGQGRKRRVSKKSSN